MENLVSDRRITIHTARWELAGEPYGPIYGPAYVHFAAPYLVWIQTVPPPDQLALYNQVPGDFACDICYYDVTTGQGGSNRLVIRELEVRRDTLTTTLVA